MVVICWNRGADPFGVTEGRLHTLESSSECDSNVDSEVSSHSLHYQTGWLFFLLYIYPDSPLKKSSLHVSFLSLYPWILGKKLQVDSKNHSLIFRCIVKHKQTKWKKPIWDILLGMAFSLSLAREIFHL